MNEDTDILNNILFNDIKIKIKDKDKKEFKKDCKGYPYLPTVLPAKIKKKGPHSTGKIIVLGDIHGDYKLLKNALKLGGVIDNNFNWIGGDSYVVQLGDQLDSCRPTEYDDCSKYPTKENDKADDIKIINKLNKLHLDAIKYGGGVFSLLGNHELMNVQGDISYASYNNLESLKNRHMTGEMVRRELFKPGGKYGKILGCTRLAVLIIGDFIFVHGGIIPEFINRIGIHNRNDLYRVNYIIRKWLIGMATQNIKKLVSTIDDSMFWNRILGQIKPNMISSDGDCVDQLDPVLRLFDVGAMVIGHTPQYFYNHLGINKTCGDKLWRVDIGLSDAFNKFDTKYNTTGMINDLRKAQVLEIYNNEELRIIK
uniref:Metallophosphatase/phosphoesterase n=1 Tax=Mimivirus LCMiAC02 TaxID=2506609 RepID=A0A481Z2C2_9VIRU|nr:MAG: metallophosphatase/phosphoesterase [Mimivirus LCMiAC02]